MRCLFTVLRGLEDGEVHAHGSGKMNERLNIFRETKTAETQAGFQELSANARIRPMA